MKKTFLAIAALAVAFASCNKDPEVQGGNNNGGDNKEPEKKVLTVVINEVDGNSKFLELYNKGEKEVSLQGYMLFKDENADAREEGSQSWLCEGKVSIKPGEHLVLWSYKSTVEGSQDNPDVIINCGLSAKQNVKLVLVDPEGDVADTFVRGEAGELGYGNHPMSGSKTESFSRVPDGTGEFVLALPTPGAANGEKTGDINQELQEPAA